MDKSQFLSLGFIYFLPPPPKKILRKLTLKNVSLPSLNRKRVNTTLYSLRGKIKGGLASPHPNNGALVSSVNHWSFLIGV